MMITLTHLNGESFILNADYIETLESRPDTVITLFNGKKYLVKETVEDVVKLVIEYKRKVRSDLLNLPKEDE